MLPQKGKTILVVEDDEGIREGLDEILRDEGYRIVLATHGEDALRALESMTPAAIILDLNMPVMGGREFLATLKKTRPEIAASVPVLLLSAAGDRATGIEGATETMRKPIDLDELLRWLEKA